MLDLDVLIHSYTDSEKQDLGVYC